MNVFNLKVKSRILYENVLCILLISFILLFLCFEGW